MVGRGLGIRRRLEFGGWLERWKRLFRRRFLGRRGELWRRGRQRELVGNMKSKEFINRLEEARIVGAIAEAERKSSGEIRVYVSHRKRTDPLAFAQKRFLELGMTNTRHRNAVLIYLVPRTRQFAIVGDRGVHEKCGDAFWRDVTARMTDLLKQGRFTDAILNAIQKVGDVLARNFPRDSEDQNELPDQIVRD